MGALGAASRPFEGQEDEAREAERIGRLMVS